MLGLNMIGTSPLAGHDKKYKFFQLHASLFSTSKNTLPSNSFNLAVSFPNSPSQHSNLDSIGKDK